MNHPALRTLSLLLGLILSAGCRSSGEKPSAANATQAPRIEYPAVGKIERFDPALDALVPVDARVERIGQGFTWAEGPVWDTPSGSLLCSDVPANTVYRWREVLGLEVYLHPSGYTGPAQRGGESGSNGLALNRDGRLILCQHGDRRVAEALPHGGFKTLAALYQGRRFNSPNDLAFGPNGDLYFTDPPYGLAQLNDDPKKELLFSGVYRLSPSGQITLLTEKLSFPNGIAFSPDQSRLYVSVSDLQNPVIMAYDVDTSGSITNGRVFFNAAPLAREGRKGLPDGLKVDQTGNLFATGPGGVLVISPEARLLGIIDPGAVASNCAWGNDGSVLYITADTTLCRIRTRTRGTIFQPAE